MKFILTTLVACAIATQLTSTLAFSLYDVASEGNPSGWNELLNAEHIFEGSVNTIEVRSNEIAVILGQLKNLLGQKQIVADVYQKFKSVYKTKSEAEDLYEFKRQLLKIAVHNLEAKSGKHSWWMGVNQFTDVKPNTNHRTTPVFFPTVKKSTSPRRSAPHVAAPATLNYVEQGKLSPVKNMLGCANACAIFAFTTILESADAISANRNSVLEGSTQELVDCATPNYCCDEPAGCNRSHTEDVYNHITRKGLSASNLYPYTDPPTTGSCRTGLTPILSAKELISKENLTEEAMKQFLADSGPLALYMYASDKFKQSYGGGIYDGADCGSEGINHAVTLVGYGTEGGQEYWLIQNSYGTQWGEKGFFRLSRSVGNVCNVLSDATTFEV